MPRNKLDWGYRITLMVTVILGFAWTQAHFVTSEKFNEFRKNLESDVDDIKFSVRRIEDRLDRRANVTTTNKLPWSAYGRRQ